MRFPALGPAVLVVLLSLSWTHPQCQNPVYEAPMRTQAARVRILAISTSVHQGYAGNQEVYLAEVSYKGHANVLAKLTDLYPASGDPIRHSLLAEHRLFRMNLSPDAECDSTGESFFLGNNSEIFDPSTTQRLRDVGQQVIPCFKVDHGATRLR